MDYYQPEVLSRVLGRSKDLLNEKEKIKHMGGLHMLQRITCYSCVLGNRKQSTTLYYPKGKIKGLESGETAGISAAE